MAKARSARMQLLGSDATETELFRPVKPGRAPDGALPRRSRRPARSRQAARLREESVLLVRRPIRPPAAGLIPIDRPNFSTAHDRKEQESGPAGAKLESRSRCGGAGQPPTRAEVLRKPSARWDASGTCLAPKQNPPKCADFLGLSKLKLNSRFPPTGVRANRAIPPVESKKIRPEGNKENEAF